MKKKRRKWLQHVIVFILVFVMLMPMTTPISVQAAENDLYLAYQNTETGKPVVQLKGASAKAVYKVTELNMSKGDNIDLCFINASKNWKNAKWTSSNEKIATVNYAGVITAVGEGIAKITLTYTNDLTKGNESTSITVYVGKDNWKLHIGTTANDIPERRELKVGRKLKLAFHGVSDWNDGRLFDFEWMSSDEKILSVDKSTGVITALRPGTAKVAIHVFNKVSNIAYNDIIEVKVLPKAYLDSTWQNGNYLTYGENYFRLFSGDYMFRIPGSILDKHVLNEYGSIAETPSGGAITESYYTAITKLNNLDRFLMGTFELLQNGTSTTVNAILGGADTYEEAKAYACILRFVEELHKNENSISSIVSDAVGTTDILNSIYTEAVDLSKTEMIDSLGDSKYLTETEIKEMVDELYANYDLIGDLVSEGVTITEYIGSAIRLHEVDEAVLYLLSQCTSYGSTLSNALDVLYMERSKNGVSACAEKYLSDKAADVINGIISEGTGGVSDVIIAATGKVEEVLHLDMDSYYAAVQFGCYQTELRFYCRDLLKEINANYNSYTEEELKDKIEAYEFAYEAYITATRLMLEETLKIAKSSEKSKIQASINALNAFDYNSAVDLAMKYFKLDNPNADEQEQTKTNVSDIPKQPTVDSSVSVSNLSAQEKMDQLYTLLGKKYFTVDQKACENSRVSAHGCTNCNMRDIAKTNWFKSLFGIINVDNFPEHDVNASRRDHTGQSCFGFACFAQWYLYADSNTDKVSAERIISAKFNKINMEKYVQPGDVIRINGHSVLVYSIEKNGLMVIDCNWNSGGQLNCLVQKHLLDYNNSNYAGYTAYINRVTGITEGKTSSIESLKLEGNQGVLDLSNTNWSAYNVGLDISMYANKAYTIYDGAELELLGKYKNSKGNTVYHVYSYDLEMECYISAKYVKVVDMTPTVLPKVTISPTPTSTVTPTPTPTVTPTPIPTISPTPTPTVTPAPEPEDKQYGSLDLSATSWKGYNVGLDKDMNADKAYTIRHGSEFEILGEYTNEKGNRVYHVYSFDLGMECYVSAKYVKVDSAETEVYGTLDLSATSWSGYNVGTTVDMYADKEYTIRHGAKLKILGEYMNSKGNKVYHVYSYDLGMNCYVTAKYVKIN